MENWCRETDGQDWNRKTMRTQLHRPGAKNENLDRGSSWGGVEKWSDPKLILKIEAKRFVHGLTKHEISAKEKSREYLHIWTLNNRMQSRTSYSDREAWTGAALERKIKNGILFLSRLRRLCDIQVETLGKELDIVGFKGKELDHKIKSSTACAREDVQGLSPGASQ